MLIHYTLSLAAITTLYLIEAARYSQYFQPNFEAAYKSLAVTGKPTKTTKIRTWISTSPPYTTEDVYNKGDGMLINSFNKIFECQLSSRYH